MDAPGSDGLLRTRLFLIKIIRQLHDCQSELGTLRFVVNTLEKPLNYLDKR